MRREWTTDVPAAGYTIGLLLLSCVWAAAVGDVGRTLITGLVSTFILGGAFGIAVHVWRQLPAERQSFQITLTELLLIPVLVSPALALLAHARHAGPHAAALQSLALLLASTMLAGGIVGWMEARIRRFNQRSDTFLSVIMIGQWSLIFAVMVFPIAGVVVALFAPHTAPVPAIAP